MKVLRFLVSGLLVLLVNGLFAQEVLNNTLLKADKHYIRKEYAFAVIDYAKYLQEYPKDYYASRQAARCYDKLNDPYNAIDFWPVVVENSEVTEEDYLDYAKCLLANNRGPEAKRIFSFLSKSSNPNVSAWGKTYLQPSFSLTDSAGVNVFELINVNTSQSENCPVFFRDKLFFVQNTQPGALNYKTPDNLALESIKVFIPKDSLQFVASLLYDKLQALNIRGQVSFSKDGSYLFFTKVLSDKEMGIKSKTPFFRHQIFILNMSTLHLPFPEIEAFEHNLSEYNSIHPCITENGERLYFSSDRKGSVGGMDIFVCVRNASGWSVPQNLGLHVNTNGNEVYPYTTGESLLYFSSDQRPGLGGLDIFSVSLSEGGLPFSEPAKNCGAPINSRFDDFGVFISDGGRKGYFSSKRKNNTDEDLYYFIRK